MGPRRTQVCRNYVAICFIAMAALACNRREPNPGAAAQAPAGVTSDAHVLSPTRLLRKISLTLRGEEPLFEEYQALLSLDESARTARLTQAIDDGLNSQQFYEQMLAFGHDSMRTTSYESGSLLGSSWIGNQAIQLTPCPSGTVHQGKWGIFTSQPIFDQGDPPSICNNPSARTDRVQDSWFAYGQMVETIGRAGTGVRVSARGRDCGVGVVNEPALNAANRLFTPDSDCSCGPHLIYCHPTIYPSGDFIVPTDGENNRADSQRRMAWEEPARLFAHVITQDKPFSDLVIGNYTVATLKLFHLYVRAARMNSANRALDDSLWFIGITDPAAWREVPFESMHPNLLNQRYYSIDPRSDAREPAGFPSAGVLTSLGSMATFARERVRAARWLETFACRAFTAPPSDVRFSPFLGDPYSGGTCQHCHHTIDPVAIYFKRVALAYYGQINIGGIGPGRWNDQLIYDENLPFARWLTAFQPGTFLTPITQAELQFNPNARFIDFLPSPNTLFGQTPDGTIGPLGFGKLLVDSGEFDTCAVQRIHQRVMGRALDPTTDTALIQQLAQSFRTNGRKVKPLIKYLMSQDAYRRGW